MKTRENYLTHYQEKPVRRQNISQPLFRQQRPNTSKKHNPASLKRSDTIIDLLGADDGDTMTQTTRAHTRKQSDVRRKKESPRRERLKYHQPINVEENTEEEQEEPELFLYEAKSSDENLYQDEEDDDPDPLTLPGPTLTSTSVALSTTNGLLNHGGSSSHPWASPEPGGLRTTAPTYPLTFNFGGPVDATKVSERYQPARNQDQNRRFGLLEEHIDSSGPAHGFEAGRDHSQHAHHAGRSIVTVPAPPRSTPLINFSVPDIWEYPDDSAVARQPEFELESKSDAKRQRTTMAATRNVNDGERERVERPNVDWEVSRRRKPSGTVSTASAYVNGNVKGNVNGNDIDKRPQGGSNFISTSTTPISSSTTQRRPTTTAAATTHAAAINLHIPPDECLPNMDETQLEWLVSFWGIYGGDFDMPVERVSTVVRLSGCVDVELARQFWEAMRKRRWREIQEGKWPVKSNPPQQRTCVTCGWGCTYCAKGAEATTAALKTGAAAKAKESEDAYPEIVVEKEPSVPAKRKRDEIDPVGAKNGPVWDGTWEKKRKGQISNVRDGGNEARRNGKGRSRDEDKHVFPGETDDEDNNSDIVVLVEVPPPRPKKQSTNNSAYTADAGDVVGLAPGRTQASPRQDIRMVDTARHGDTLYTSIWEDRQRADRTSVGGVAPLYTGGMPTSEARYSGWRGGNPVSAYPQRSYPQGTYPQGVYHQGAYPQEPPLIDLTTPIVDLTKPTEYDSAERRSRSVTSIAFLLAPTNTSEDDARERSQAKYAKEGFGTGGGVTLNAVQDGRVETAQAWGARADDKDKGVVEVTEDGGAEVLKQQERAGVLVGRGKVAGLKPTEQEERSRLLETKHEKARGGDGKSLVVEPCADDRATAFPSDAAQHQPSINPSGNHEVGTKASNPRDTATTSALTPRKRGRPELNRMAKQENRPVVENSSSRRRSSRVRVPIHNNLNVEKVVRSMLVNTSDKEPSPEIQAHVAKHRHHAPGSADDRTPVSPMTSDKDSKPSRSGRGLKRRRLDADADADANANAKSPSADPPTQVMTRRQAVENARRVPQESLHIQRNRCVGRVYGRLDKCRACTRKAAGDTCCRFQMFRAFEIIPTLPNTVGDAGATSVPRGTVRLDKNETIALVPLFVSSTVPDPQYRIGKPNRSTNRDFARTVEAFILRTISGPLETMLAREMVHLRSDESFRRLPAPYVRHLCDYCLTSIFNSYWTCSSCGVDMCLDCYDAWDEGGVARASRCSFDKVHTKMQMLSMSKFMKESLEEVWKAAVNTRKIQCKGRDQRESERGWEEVGEPELEVEESVVLEGTLVPIVTGSFETSSHVRLDNIPRPTTGTSSFDTTTTFNQDIFSSSPLSPTHSSESSVGSPTRSPCYSPSLHPTSPSSLPQSPLRMSSQQSHPPSPLQQQQQVSPHPQSPSSLPFLYASASAVQLVQFQDRWRRGEAVVIRDVLGESRVTWSPDHFVKQYGARDVDVIDCETGITVASTVERFFEGFEDVSKREKHTNGKYKVLKLKDWPPRQDFRDEFPVLYEDFMAVLPFKDYTGDNGVLNLASRLPDTFVPPDLGPKMYIAYGSDDGEEGKGTTNLHCDMADAVNVMFYSSAVDQTSEHKKVAAAVWDIFPADDLPKIKNFLNIYAQEVKYNHIVDPVHDQWIYLDAKLRQRLWEEHGVRPWRIYQNPGDAVFIPAGCAHQVCNYAAAVKCAMDFVSPENVVRCAELTKEFRLMSQIGAKRKKEDVLQLRNILFFAWASCDQFLGSGAEGREDGEEGAMAVERESVGGKLVTEVPWDEVEGERVVRRAKEKKEAETTMKSQLKKRMTILARKHARRTVDHRTVDHGDGEESFSDGTINTGTPEPRQSARVASPPKDVGSAGQVLSVPREGEDIVLDEMLAKSKPQPRKRGRKPKTQVAKSGEEGVDGATNATKKSAPGKRGRKPAAKKEENAVGEGNVDDGCAIKWIPTEPAPKKRLGRPPKDRSAEKVEGVTAESEKVKKSKKTAVKKLATAVGGASSVEKKSPVKEMMEVDEAPLAKGMSMGGMELSFVMEGSPVTARETTARETTVRETTVRETTVRETTVREPTLLKIIDWQQGRLRE